MTQQIINIGAAPNDGTGDQLRSSFDKCNLNFTELYQGVAKGVSIGAAIEYQFNNTTTEPPASGQIRFNQATQASTTKLWASHTTSSGINIKQFLSAATTGAKLILQDENDNTNYIKFDITAPPVDKTTYWEFAVAVTASGGNLPNATILAAVTAAAGGGGSTVLLRGYIDGLTLARVSNTSFSVAVGQATDSANAALVSLAAAITKTTGTWAVGSGNGGLDTGTIAANTWYHVFLIQRSDTSVVDVAFSTGLTLTTPPTNYDRKRRIGSIRTNASSQFTNFTQNADHFSWKAIVQDQSFGTGWTSTAADVTLTVPTGISVLAAVVINTGASGSNQSFFLYDKAMTDPTMSAGGEPAMAIATTGLARGVGGLIYVRTNTSAQVRKLSSDASGVGSIHTLGWIDQRGKNV